MNSNCGKPSIHGLCIGYSMNKARETLLSVSLWNMSFIVLVLLSLENLISVPQMCSQMWSSSHTGLLDKAKRFCWLFMDISHSTELEAFKGCDDSVLSCTLSLLMGRRFQQFQISWSFSNTYLKLHSEWGGKGTTHVSMAHNYFYLKSIDYRCPDNKAMCF